MDDQTNNPAPGQEIAPTPHPDNQAIPPVFMPPVTEMAEIVPQSIAPGETSPIEAQVTPRAQDPASSPSGVTLDGVESGFGVFVRKRWWLIIIGIVLTLAIGVGLVLAHSNPLFSFVPAVLLMGYLKRTYEDSLFLAFANTNHFTYVKKGELNGQPGLIFSLGHGRKYSDIVSGSYQSWTFSLFMYAYTIGYGRGSHRYDRAVMAVSFNTPLPAFVLKKHKMLEMLEEEGQSLRASGYNNSVNLEGDFSKHFEVYIKSDSQVDVLSILTPDVMEMLLGLDKYEVEMTESGIFYVYCPGYITKKQSLIDIYTIIEAVTPKIGRYANRQQELSNLAATVQ